MHVARSGLAPDKRAAWRCAGALGAAGLVVGGVSVIGAVRELAALDADTRALVLVGYGVVALAGAGMALAGLRLATSAEARDYARLVGRRLARRKR